MSEVTQSTPAAPVATAEQATPAPVNPAVSTPAKVEGQPEATAAVATTGEIPSLVAPEPQRFELKLPEGSILDQSAVERVSAFAKEMKLTPEAAQKVLEQEHMVLEGYAKTLDEQFAAKKQEWATQAFSDKELGGPQFKENIELAHRVIKRFAPQEFIQDLESSGLGNHPGLLKTFNRLGKAMSEDKLVQPGAQAGGQKSIEEHLYGKQT